MLRILACGQENDSGRKLYEIRHRWAAGVLQSERVSVAEGTRQIGTVTLGEGSPHVNAFGSNSRKEELFIKNTGLRQLARGNMWSDVFPVVPDKRRCASIEDNQHLTEAVTLTVIK